MVIYDIEKDSDGRWYVTHDGERCLGWHSDIHRASAHCKSLAENWAKSHMLKASFEIPRGGSKAVWVVK